MELTIMFFKLIVSLGIVLGIMILTFKFANNGVKRINGDKYIEVIERTQIGKDSSLIIVKIGDEGIIMSVTNGHTEKLKNLTKEEITEIEMNKRNKDEELKIIYDSMGNTIKTKIETIYKKIGAKEKKNE